MIENLMDRDDKKKDVTVKSELKDFITAADGLLGLVIIVAVCVFFGVVFPLIFNWGA